MKIPATENSLALRTDFSDEVGWKAVCAAIQEPQGEFSAYVDFVSDPEFSGLEAFELLAVPSEDPHRSFVFVIDRIALSHPEHPILVLDLLDEPSRTFRVVPSEIWGIENNLSLGNMDFNEFADAVDQDGVFRGFPGP